MAALEILCLDEGTPQVRAPGASDTYLFPRNAEWTTGVNTSNVAHSGSAVAFTFDTSGAYTTQSGHRLVSVRNNGTEQLGISFGGNNQSTGTLFTTPGPFCVAAGGVTNADFEYAPFLGASIFNVRGTGGLIFNNYVTNGATAKAVHFQCQTNLTTAGALIARFSHNLGTSGLIDFTKDGGIKAAGGLGLFGTTPLTSQYSTTGTTTGFTAATGTNVLSGSTFTGNTGATAYTIGDVVRSLKQHGLLAA